MESTAIFYFLGDECSLTTITQINGKVCTLFESEMVINLLEH